jgi:heat induced stress protein YflT
MSDTASTRAEAGASDRVTVASFAHYDEAETAVDYLSDRRFPVERVAIIGHDVKMVEQVVGRLNYGRAAVAGAAAGALPGALIGWLFGLLDWIRPLLAGLALAAYGLIFGAVVGALMGLLVYALQQGRRDFVAVRGLRPSRYDVVVDMEVAQDAASLLRERRTTSDGTVV